MIKNTPIINNQENTFKINNITYSINKKNNVILNIYQDKITNETEQVEFTNIKLSEPTSILINDDNNLIHISNNIKLGVNIIKNNIKHIKFRDEYIVPILKNIIYNKPKYNVKQFTYLTINLMYNNLMYNNLELENTKPYNKYLVETDQKYTWYYTLPLLFNIDILNKILNINLIHITDRINNNDNSPLFNYKSLKLSKYFPEINIENPKIPI